MKRILAAMMALLLALAGLNIALAEDAGSIEKIVVTAENRGFGQEALSIVITVADTTPYQALTEQDYTMTGCMIDKRTMAETEMHPVKVTYTQNEIQLDVEPFIVQSSKRHFAFTCTDPSLNFNYKAITEILCPNVEQFTDEQTTVGDTTLQYHLYSPEAGENLPVVIYHHGGGCTGYDGVLTDDCFASAWITGDAQAEFPCYVIAPYRSSLKDEEVDGDDEMACVKQAIDQLIEAGKVDANRVYMGGESMGCIYTARFASRYPGYLAAIILMNGGPFEVEEDADLAESIDLVLGAPYSDEELKTLAESGTAVMVVQGVGDTLSVPTRLATVYKKLARFGMVEGETVVWKPYSADAYNAMLRCVTKVFHIGDTEAERAVDPITGEETWKDGLFHNTSRVTAWDPEVRAWLSAQSLAN